MLTRSRTIRYKGAKYTKVAATTFPYNAVKRLGEQAGDQLADCVAGTYVSWTTITQEEKDAVVGKAFRVFEEYFHQSFWAYFGEK